MNVYSIRQQGFPFILDSGGIVFYLINMFQIKQKKSPYLPDEDFSNLITFPWPTEYPHQQVIDPSVLNS